MKTLILFFLYSLITDGVFGESLSVKEGESVTLHTGPSEIKKDDVIDWRFGGFLIARVRNNNNPSVYEDALGGKFRGRLKLDGQTGDLTITNFRNTDSGEYKVSNIINTIKNKFNVTVVSADAVKLVTVHKGDPVTLKVDPNYIPDVVQWKYGQQKSLVAELNRMAGKFGNTYDVLDGKFKGRLKLDNQTGFLIITNTTNTDSGDYEVDISSSSSSYTRHRTQSFRVTVNADVESVTGLKGHEVTLHTGLTGIQTDDQIVWKFGDDGNVIANLTC